MATTTKEPEPSLAAKFTPYTDTDKNVKYVQYDPTQEETLLPAMRDLISGDLSEPYSIYVYRYFLYEWGHLCFLVSPSLTSPAQDPKRSSHHTENNHELTTKALNPQTSALLATIICKLEPHRDGPMRGYIAMLATAAPHRGRGIASTLVAHAVRAMAAEGADEVALETEVSNVPSLRLYERAGFLRSKRLGRYYLNGSEAFRLVLYLKPGVAAIPTRPPEWPGHDEDAEAGAREY